MAHLSDANPNATANDFSAQITWGDGSTSSSSVSAVASGGFDVTSTHTSNTAGNYPVNTAGNYPVNTTITDLGASNPRATATATITTTTTTTTTPPIGQQPVNITKPFVAFSPASNSFVCDPGTWQNVPADQTFAYEWLRRTPAAAVSLVAPTRTFRPGDSAAHDVFSCRVTVPGFTGSTIAAPVFTRLVPTEVPISAYGNFRLRGIDVFQVVQPNSCAAMFGFPTAAFPCLSGGGTPTSYGASGKLAPGADPQRTNYTGVQIDADKRTTAVVYVDRTFAVAAGPGRS